MKAGVVTKTGRRDRFAIPQGSFKTGSGPRLVPFAHALHFPIPAGNPSRQLARGSATV